MAMIAIKQAAARVNMSEGKLDKKLGNAIIKACKKLRSGGYEDNFPLSVLANWFRNPDKHECK